MLSLSTYSFARTWWTHLAGFDLTEFGLDEADESRKRAEIPVANDDEKDHREADALRMGGSWLRQYRDELLPFLQEISEELRRLGWTREVVQQDLGAVKHFPSEAKFDELYGWIQKNLMVKKTFRSDERLIIFTEYKDTLDYLLARFKAVGIEEPLLQTLYGGASSEQRRKVKAEFNDSSSQLRILLATDAASEGLNLQNSCRYVIHQEIPWNPMRLEQRNGRVDRHGQSRDIFVWHFVSNQVQDLEFLDFVVKKVDTVRGDLGSVGKVLDEAVTEYFAKGTVTNKDIDFRVGKTMEYADNRVDLGGGMHVSESEYQKAVRSFASTRNQFGFDEDRIARLLSEAVSSECGRLAQISEGTFRFEVVPPNWKRLVENTLLLDSRGAPGAHPKLVFSPERVQEIVNGRVMFVPRKDTRLLMLGHPLMQKALSAFVRRLWLPSHEAKIAKWTVQETTLAAAIPCIITLFLQVSLRNKLGERIRTGILEVPVSAKDAPEIIHKSSWDTIRSQEWQNLPVDSSWNAKMKTVASRWQRIKPFADQLRSQIIDKVRTASTADLEKQLKLQIKEHKDLFNERRKALEVQRNSRGSDALRKELLKAEERAVQLTFSEEMNAIHRQRVRELRERLSEEEWERQHSHIELLRQRLEDEERRIIERVLPKRFSLDDDGVEVLPVAIHVLLNTREGTS